MDGIDAEEDSASCDSIGATVVSTSAVSGDDDRASMRRNPVTVVKLVAVRA